MSSRRAPIVLSSTVAGLALTLGFHAHRPSATRGARAAATTTGATPSAASTTSPPVASPSSGATVTSDVESNQYGNVQLQVTVKAGKITAVQALQLPQNDGKSVQINAYAAPVLRQSTLTAQSAGIDAVSGATYTSDSYKLALQSALDKAGASGRSGSTA